VGIARAHGYGLRFGGYVADANALVSVVVQAEHIRAVENIEKIVQVEGVDAVLVGPYDLSASLGRMGEVDHPQVVEAIERVTEVCRSAGIPLGIFGTSVAAVQPYAAKGYTLLVAGVDTLLLGLGAKALRAEFGENASAS
jgi:2-dehydro-3-deoxyglucarate aldolase